MKKSAAFLVTISLVSLLTACSTTNSVPYKSSTANVIAIQNALKSSGKKLSVGTFKAAAGVDENLACRLMGPINVAPGKTFSTYIQEAFQEELFLAQAYDPNSPIVINGELEKLSFSSVSPANWNIALRVSTKNNPGYTSTVTYTFDTSFDAYSACQNVANAFGPAVQDLLKKVVNDPQFSKLN